MMYTSTRDSSVKVTASAAITKGISSDGGLFLPVEIPQIDSAFLSNLIGLSYIERAEKILSLFLDDFSFEEIKYCVEGAYKEGKFSSDKVAPLKKLENDEYILELWHGPTCAFKDMALQLLPYLLTESSNKTLKDKEIVILVATSGDTGKAALEGFKDVKGTKILVFYPVNGVSKMQKLQMITQEGENVSVCAIEGNFDDAQNGVKSIFVNKEIEEKFAENNLVFSSANSINWGRLVPQIVYYISAYVDLVNEKAINNGDKIDIVVPTGNFGNILAAYYAKLMGTPINKLICASNSNNVLTDFLKTGIYDRNRDFYCTESPSMDILISSNLERLLYILTNNDKLVNVWMDELKTTGKYTVSDEILAKIQDSFEAGYCDDKATEKTIKETFEKYNYLLDTHTSVAVNVYEQYKAQKNDNIVTVIASTANPYKFPKSVLSALSSDIKSDNEYDMIGELSDLTNMQVPLQLSSLKDKKIKFNNVCKKDNMAKIVFDMLGI